MLGLLLFSCFINDVTDHLDPAASAKLFADDIKLYTSFTNIPVNRRIEFKTCALVYKCLHGVAPGYLSELMMSVAMDVGRRHLRSAAHGDLIIPASRTKTFGPRAFAIAAPQGRNNVSMDLHDSSMSYREFCSKLKTYLYRQVFL